MISDKIAEAIKKMGAEKKSRNNKTATTVQSQKHFNKFLFIKGIINFGDGLPFVTLT